MLDSEKGLDLMAQFSALFPAMAHLTSNSGIFGLHIFFFFTSVHKLKLASV